jgi:hypothetical protein
LLGHDGLVRYRNFKGVLQTIPEGLYFCRRPVVLENGIRIYLVENLEYRLGGVGVMDKVQ